MRHVARRGDGIPATKHCGAYRREDDGSGGAGSGREAELPSTVPNSTRGAKRGHGRGRSRADRSRGWRVAQDSPPKPYMYTASGAKDAQIARPAQGARLPRPRPHIDRQTSTAQTNIANPTRSQVSLREEPEDHHRVRHVVDDGLVHRDREVDVGVVLHDREALLAARVRRVLVGVAREVLVRPLDLHAVHGKARRAVSAVVERASHGAAPEPRVIKGAPS